MKPRDEDETIFGDMWDEIRSQIERDLADEASPSDEAE